MCAGDRTHHRITRHSSANMTARYTQQHTRHALWKPLPLLSVIVLPADASNLPQGNAV
jgi:hypothetical protein